MPLFQEKIRARADGTGFEFQGMALSPTVQQAGPAGVTPSRLLSAAEGAYSAGSQTYRGSVMPTWHPNAMVPTPVRLPMFQHPHGEGFGTEEVGTNRKRLLVGNRTGPLGQTRSMPVVAYNDTACYGPGPLRVRKKTLEGSVECDWISKMKAACDV